MRRCTTQNTLHQCGSFNAASACGAVVLCSYRAPLTAPLAHAPLDAMLHSFELERQR
jgi:hypothetical protein